MNSKPQSKTWPDRQSKVETAKPNKPPLLEADAFAVRVTAIARAALYVAGLTESKESPKRRHCRDPTPQSSVTSREDSESEGSSMLEHPLLSTREKLDYCEKFHSPQTQAPLCHARRSPSLSYRFRFLRGSGHITGSAAT